MCRLNLGENSIVKTYQAQNFVGHNLTIEVCGVLLYEFQFCVCSFYSSFWYLTVID